MKDNATGEAMDRRMQLRHAVLLTFCEPMPEACTLLQRVSAGEWRSLLRWLDTSGLALYFFDRLRGSDRAGMLPAEVAARLENSLRENTARMHAMMEESAALHIAFQRAGLRYATQKGFSLWPHSVPAPELRSQLDLDFLIAEDCASEARRILELHGYRLDAISGNSWEFKAQEAVGTSLRDLYKASRHRTVELHLECGDAGRASVLSRVEEREILGVRMPVLPAEEVFLGQGLHLYKHVCSAFVRAAHVLEFRRHVLYWADDHAFWWELRARATRHVDAALGLGVATLLTTHAMGAFAPEALTSWTVDRVPIAARLWLKRYGRQMATASFPGSKLYLLLEKELQEHGVAVVRTVPQTLLPVTLPRTVYQPAAGESLRACLRRYGHQLRYVAHRLRFHVVEGFRYLIESLRWRLYRGGLAQ